MAGVIIDNGGAGYSTVGSWSNYNGYGGYNNTLQYNSNGGSGASATWAFTGLTAGAKWLGLSWVGLGSNSTVTPWQILDSNGTTVLASGTVNQQVSPSGELSGGARFQFLASVTISGTSCSVKMTGLASGQVMSDAAVVHPSTDPITSGSIAAGNWSSGSTWTGGHVPVSGDLAVINHAVTVAADAVIGDGTASTVLTVGAAGTGSLTVSGAKLTIRGNCDVGLSGTAGTWLVVQNNGATPGGIVFYGNSGVRPTLGFADDSVMTVTGTSSARCYLRSSAISKGDAADNAGSNAIVRNDPSSGNLRGLYTTIAYCDLYKLGDSGVAGITASRLDNSGFIAHPPFTMDHCAIDSCGVVPQATISGLTVNFQLTACTWTGKLASVPAAAGANSGTVTGTRLIDGCVFEDSPSLSGTNGFTITNSYFNGYMTADNADHWAAFDGNFYTTSGVLVNQAICGDFTNNYCLWHNPAGTNASGDIKASFFDAAFTGNIYQRETPDSDVGYCVVQGESGSAHTITHSGNIVLRSSTGARTLIYGMLCSNPSYGLITTNFEHNTVPLGSNYAAVQTGSATSSAANTFAKFKANLFWETAAASGEAYAFKLQDDPTPTVNAMPASVCDYNGHWNVKATPAGTWSSLSCTIQDGTPYNTPMSGSTAPGAHDVVGDPGFVDATRNLHTWSVYKGYSAVGDGAATKVANALAAIKADPSLTKTDLIPWVRAGYRPTNVALRAASYAGDASMTDAAGNAWPGAGPDIGAMAYVAASVTGNPYLIQSAHDGGFFGG